MEYVILCMVNSNYILLKDVKERELRKYEKDYEVINSLEQLKDSRILY